ncbi:MAG: EamA/RhaT family transporter [Pseudomonadota bacterium]
METWILIAIAAAAFQTLRFMLQKSLSMGPLSAGGATAARFFYGAPFACLLITAYLAWRGVGFPALSGMFWAYASIGGLAQILATLFVVLIFAERNFAVGITFKKTEVIQTAIVGFAVLGDRVSLLGFLAILIGLLGVLVLSDPPKSGMHGWRRFTNRAAGLGLASGAFFAVSAVGYRGAVLEIGVSDAFLRGMLTVAVVTVMQSAAMAVWLGVREPGEIGRIWAARRAAVWIGVTSMAGSVGWFTAFALQNAAYVFAVGQVEVIFSLLASVLFFKERVAAREMLGIALLTASIVVLVVFG